MFKVKQIFMCMMAMLILASGAVFAQVVSGQAAPNFTLTDTKGQKTFLVGL